MLRVKAQGVGDVLTNFGRTFRDLPLNRERSV